MGREEDDDKFEELEGDIIDIFDREGTTDDEAIEVLESLLARYRAA